MQINSVCRALARHFELRPTYVFSALIVTLYVCFSAANAEVRVLPEGERPADARLEGLRTLNGYFPFVPPKTKEAWEARAERVRRQLLLATGLWPMPTKSKLDAVVHGKVDRGDYTVEKVFFESFPGHFVTGNLYRPKQIKGKAPGVLCPHGHWRDGRFYDAGEKELHKQIVVGAERFDPGGRYPIQSRCAKLARMGCIVFHYDMVGYADSVQLPHGPGVRPSMNTTTDWGYFSPQAELRCQNMMGLQAFNSIRALDWLASLPEVDTSRIAVTGASGGGTQTFVLCAVDPRPAVAFPAVMVSTAMQGGCTCENACYLRIGAGNVDFAALFAPKPLGMTAANDWTKEMATKGFPELQKLYEMLGAKDRVKLTAYTHFPHNYNYPSRAAMYAWFNRHLKLGFSDPVIEEDFQPLTIEEMSVWDDAHPKPAGGDAYERSLLKWITRDSENQIRGLIPQDAESLAKFREVVGGAFEIILGRGLPEADEVEDEKLGAVEASQTGGAACETWLVRNKTAKEEIPAVVLLPETPTGKIVLWISSKGKQGLWNESGAVVSPVKSLLDGGAFVVGIDLFGQGEFTKDGKPLETQPMNNPKEKVGSKAYAGYTYGYNSPLFAKRVHDILTTVAAIRAKTAESGSTVELTVAGLDGSGHWVAAAGAAAGDAIDRIAVDTEGFRFASVNALDHADFLPGAVKYMDLPGLLALRAPHPMWLAGEGEKPPVISDTYRAADSNRLVIYDGDASERNDAAVAWIIE